jgi:hypothetical protein
MGRERGSYDIQGNSQMAKMPGAPAGGGPGPGPGANESASAYAGYPGSLGSPGGGEGGRARLLVTWYINIAPLAYIILCTTAQYTPGPVL